MKRKIMTLVNIFGIQETLIQILWTDIWRHRAFPESCTSHSIYLVST